MAFGDDLYSAQAGLVVTFLVSYTGMVDQKDLGDDTEKLLQRMNSFDADHSGKGHARDFTIPML